MKYPVSSMRGAVREKIYSFTDLEAWKEGHKLVLRVYEATRAFPKEEQFGLVSQMRRAAVSITSNIAEGFSRSSYREKAQFYFHALGSLTELQNQLLIARDVQYLTSGECGELMAQSSLVQKLTKGLINYAKSVSSP